MIKSWNKYVNESSSTVNKDIIQELIFFIEAQDHNDKSDSLDKLSNNLLDMLATNYYEFIYEIFYDPDYDEIIKLVNDIYNSCLSNPELYKSILEHYNIIRKATSKYPELIEIEDYFLEFIDDGYIMWFRICEEYLDVTFRSRHWDKSVKLDEFIKLYSKVLSSMNRISKGNKEIRKYEYDNNSASFCIRIK